MSRHSIQLEGRPGIARCADETTLAAFDSGQLDPLASEAVMAHLEGCDKCLERLDKMNRAGDGLTLFLREGGRSDELCDGLRPTEVVRKPKRVARWKIIAGICVAAGGLAVAAA